jgi:hypothetical protein
MELGSIWVVLLCSFGALVALKWLLKNANSWLHETQLGDTQYSLPPGDLGWPFIGNMWSFLRAFKSHDPESFISSFVSRSHLSLSLSLYIDVHIFALTLLKLHCFSLSLSLSLSQLKRSSKLNGVAPHRPKSGRRKVS